MFCNNQPLDEADQYRDDHSRGLVINFIFKLPAICNMKNSGIPDADCLITPVVETASRGLLIIIMKRYMLTDSKGPSRVPVKLMAMSIPTRMEGRGNCHMYIHHEHLASP